MRTKNWWKNENIKNCTFFFFSFHFFFVSFLFSLCCSRYCRFRISFFVFFLPVPLIITRRAGKMTPQAKVDLFFLPFAFLSLLSLLSFLFFSLPVPLMITRRAGKLTPQAKVDVEIKTWILHCLNRVSINSRSSDFKPEKKKT